MGMAVRGPSENLLCKNDQTLSVNANPLDLFDQSLLLDMIILGTHQLCGGVNILSFYKVSFEKHPNIHMMMVLMIITNIQIYIYVCMIILIICILCVPPCTLMGGTLPQVTSANKVKVIITITSSSL